MEKSVKTDFLFFSIFLEIKGFLNGIFLRIFEVF